LGDQSYLDDQTLWDPSTPATPLQASIPLCTHPCSICLVVPCLCDVFRSASRISNVTSSIGSSVSRVTPESGCATPFLDATVLPLLDATVPFWDNLGSGFMEFVPRSSTQPNDDSAIASSLASASPSRRSSFWQSSLSLHASTRPSPAPLHDVINDVVSSRATVMADVTEPVTPIPSPTPGRHVRKASLAAISRLLQPCRSAAASKSTPREDSASCLDENADSVSGTASDSSDSEDWQHNARPSPLKPRPAAAKRLRAICNASDANASDASIGLSAAPQLGDKKYRCPHCAFSCNDSGNIVRHRRRHGTEKPYACGTCSRGFINSSNRRKHEKSCRGGSQEERGPGGGPS
jgi:hypothetical protein